MCVCVIVFVTVFAMVLRGTQVKAVAASDRSGAASEPFP
jgi:hypothetical protein